MYVGWTIYRKSIEIGRIGDGIIECWVDAESEVFDFLGLYDRTFIEHLCIWSVYEVYLRCIWSVSGVENL